MSLYYVNLYFAIFQHFDCHLEVLKLREIEIHKVVAIYQRTDKPRSNECFKLLPTHTFIIPQLFIMSSSKELILTTQINTAIKLILLTKKKNHPESFHVSWKRNILSTYINVYIKNKRGRKKYINCGWILCQGQGFIVLLKFTQVWHFFSFFHSL